MSTYPPRICGIGSFTRDLARALTIRRHVQRNVVVPIENDSSRRSDKNAIDQFDRRSYVNAARLLNESNVDLVNIQHEFGIFGGELGMYVLSLCRNLRPPLVTTFHTVLPDPNEKMLEIIRTISNLSATVVVTVESAKKLLSCEYFVNEQKIEVVPHGAHAPDQKRRNFGRNSLHLTNRNVLATTGLINPGKGAEFVIKALPYLIEKWPNLLYLVIGETHPEVRKRDGEVYRDQLAQLVRELKLERNVRFVDQYLPQDDLSLYLQATDVYIAPYLGRDQVSSGTITLALTHGKAIVSTPTVFAKEALAHDRGILCDFADSRSIARCIRRILIDSTFRHRLEMNAFKYGRELGWARVADQYAEVFRSAMQLSRAVSETPAISEV